MAVDCPNVTKKDIQAWLDLDRRRKACDRESEQLKKEQAVIGEKLLAFIRAKEPKALSTLRSGYRLAIKLVKGSVSWKPEFVRVAGLPAAEELSAACPQREALVVETA